jgi:hypothetical protein
MIVFNKENRQYALKLHLSAIAPLTIVVAVVENESWNKNAAKIWPSKNKKS